MDTTTEDKERLKNTLGLLFQKYLYDCRNLIYFCDCMIKKSEDREGVYLDYRARKTEIENDMRKRKKVVKRLSKMIDEN